MNRTDALLILNAISGLGSITIRKLIRYYGSAVQVLSSSTRMLKETRIVPERVITQITSFPQDEFLTKEYQLIREKGINLVSYQDAYYPQNLKEIADFPVVFYVKGTLPRQNDLSIAMVGSRRASVYGLGVSEKFAMALAELGIVVVSGMARGIDTAAHRGALKAKGTTVAVFGCGLGNMYPPENEKLAQAICSQGALISEFPMTMSPLACNFPKRNRIISGLSLGVVVVEAAVKSGALITSNFALEQGREVFAVPGKVDTPNAGGTNRLIKQGAKLVSSIEDILEELKPHIRQYLDENRPTNHGMTCVQNHPSLNDEEKRIYERLTQKPQHIDGLAQACQISLAKTMFLLLQLELKGLVRQLPGKMFVNKEEALAVSSC